MAQVTPTSLWTDFGEAFDDENGYLLADTICPEPPASDSGRLYTFLRSMKPSGVRADLQHKLRDNRGLRLPIDVANVWIEVFVAYHAFTAKFIKTEIAESKGQEKDVDWNAVYESWKEVVSALSKGYQSGNLAAWTLPCIYVGGKYLRIFAIKADKQKVAQRDSGVDFGGLEEGDPSSQNDTLSDAARQINKLFGLCLHDRSPLNDSRKWGAYNITNLLFKTYFKLNNVPLCKNILRSLQASNADMPSLDNYPKADRVTFNYYNGVLAFLEEDYAAAESFLAAALTVCDKRVTNNVQLILTYLIPTKMLTSHKLPSAAFLKQYPNIERWFSPIREAVRRSDLKAFNAALEQGEDEFVKRRIYLTLERGQDIIIRNLFRKVYLAGGYEEQKPGETGPAKRRTRIPTDEFAAALRLAGAEVGDGNGGVDRDAVECIIANSIYKGFMKGYISREHGKIVLNKNGAFPGTGV